MKAAKAQHGKLADSELPAGWTLARVGDLAGITSGKFIKRSEYSQIQDMAYPVAGAGGPIGWTDQWELGTPFSFSDLFTVRFNKLQGSRFWLYSFWDC
jgi:hypothetical protein